jgi:hypothetical protein
VVGNNQADDAAREKRVQIVCGSLHGEPDGVVGLASKGWPRERSRDQQRRGKAQDVSSLSHFQLIS